MPIPVLRRYFNNSDLSLTYDFRWMRNADRGKLPLDPTLISPVLLFSALVGVILIVWALPRLAQRFGVQPATAIWLGAANPLLIFHFVAGAHNDALAIGLMVAGLELGAGIFVNIVRQLAASAEHDRVGRPAP